MTTAMSATVRGAVVEVSNLRKSYDGRAVVDELLARGRVARGYVGLGMQAVRIPERAARESDVGLMVVSVEPNGPADRRTHRRGHTPSLADRTPRRHRPSSSTRHQPDG